MGALLATIMSFMIGILAIPVVKQAENHNLHATVLADAASQFQTILTGAQKYAAARKDTLTDTLNVGGTYQEIPFSDLRNTDSIPTGFSQQNVLGATWHVYAQQPASGAVLTMVSAEGGQTLTPGDMVKIAGLTGDLGGYVPYDGMQGNLSSSEAHGTTWNLSLAGLPSPGAGHLFGTVTVGDAASPTIDTNDFLYRVGVPGHDNLNTMQVDLNMGTNNITNAGTIDATQGVFSGNVFAQSGNIVDFSATNAIVGGEMQAGSVAAGSADIVALAARNVRIDENAQIYGTLNVNGKATMDAAITGTDGGTAIAGNACTDNGAIASTPDGTGNHLECVSGLWKKLGGVSNVVPIFAETLSTKDTGWVANSTGGVLFVSIFGADSENCNQSGYELHSYTTNQGVVDLTKYNGGLFASGNDYFFVEPGESWRVTSDPWNGCQNPTFIARGVMIQ